MRFLYGFLTHKYQESPQRVAFTTSCQPGFLTIQGKSRTYSFERSPNICTQNVKEVAKMTQKTLLMQWPSRDYCNAYTQPSAKNNQQPARGGWDRPVFQANIYHTNLRDECSKLDVHILILLDQSLQNTCLLATKQWRSLWTNSETSLWLVWLKHFTNTAYEPQISGRPEIYYSTLIARLHYHVAESQRDWGIFVEHFTYTYNS